MGEKKTHNMYMKYICAPCSFQTHNKKDYERHLSTSKHVNNSGQTKYICDVCNFTAYYKAVWLRHIKTRKHIAAVENEEDIVCEYCDKSFKHRSGLSRHKLKCNNDVNSTTNNTNISINQLSNILEQQQNIFGQQQIILGEQQKTMMSEIMAKVTENCSITNITNNTTNNTDNKFNLNIFLNETCKNAMTLEHFLNNLQIEIEDIEYVGTHGYVEGMTHIITERLNALDITERPIHCTDVKRETMHIKGEDAWHKDVDDEKINSLVGIVAKLNYRKLPDWREQHPHFLDSSNPDFDYHLKMLGNILGAHQNSNVDKKVVKNIAKHTALDKPRLAMKYV
jgi:hypothetical protein|tara:strand:- start:42 stop:1055 length:1014 start_codon:yes stop_codon:yes gene_type:complete